VMFESKINISIFFSHEPIQIQITKHQQHTNLS